MTDPNADFLTRLRNGVKAGHRVDEIPASNLKKEITKILFEKGYILNFKFVEDGPQGSIKVALKYDRSGRVNALKALKRVSRPGLRKYVGYREMPRVLNGLGIAILSTSRGVMTDKEASQLKVAKYAVYTGCVLAPRGTLRVQCSFRCPREEGGAAGDHGGVLLANTTVYRGYQGT